ncbi:glycerate kinase [Gordonia sp. TBRC 11910]|uniref:Glycerate kinase n=1 Tax=Gordonia asplenii TaxID=2725283 RepID=A0A848KW99_9ACTN|nr:glycerate kinase [Gordonia asplenii]NMN99747.1 glycerate kinase [Gordonia asplenii]
MRIVLAPDKFRGSLTAPQVADHLATGLRAVVDGVVVDVAPVADGGEGTVDAALGACFTSRTVPVTGPDGATVDAAFAVDGTRAVIEMAAASGLDLVAPSERDALGATSRGTGELIGAALDLGCTDIVLGVGGSACTDGGTGMLAALGARLFDADGAVLPDGGGTLTRLHRIDVSALDPRLATTTFTLAGDVDNVLLGARGAAAVFGPQKGASPADVDVLDAGLTRLTQVLAEQLGHRAVDVAAAPGAGAAGGVGYAAMVVLDARRRPGIDVVLDVVGLADRIAGADLVITGEGSLDEQSLGGKTPIGVARLAARASVPVVAVCGRTTLTPQQLADAGFARTYALTDLVDDTETAIRDAARLTTRTGQLIGRGVNELIASRSRV